MRAKGKQKQDCKCQSRSERPATCTQSPSHCSNTSCSCCRFVHSTLSLSLSSATSLYSTRAYPPALFRHPLGVGLNGKCIARLRFPGFSSDAVLQIPATLAQREARHEAGMHMSDPCKPGRKGFRTQTLDTRILVLLSRVSPAIHTSALSVRLVIIVVCVRIPASKRE